MHSIGSFVIWLGAGLMILETVLALKDHNEDLHQTIAGWREQYFAVPETNFDMRIPNPNVSKEEQDELLDKCVIRVKELGEAEGGQERKSYDVGPDPADLEVEWPTLKMEFYDLEQNPDYNWWFCVRPSGNETVITNESSAPSTVASTSTSASDKRLSSLRKEP